MYLETSTARINYETHGMEGSWVTLVNGHTRSLRDFKMFTKKLVLSGFRVLLIDNRGAGDSQANFPFTLEDMAQDVIDIWDELNIDRSSLLGISMGGMISQIAASEQAQRVTSLVLISTSADNKYLSDIANEEWGTTLESIEKKLSYYFEQDFYIKNKLLVKSMAKVMLKKQEDGFDEGAYLQRQAISQSTLDGIQNNIKCPVLIMHGESDNIIGVEAAKDLGKLIEDSTVEVYKKIGHLLIAEAPQQTYTNSINFFLKHGH